MELRVLRYFVAVAREESISAAAEFLHISQPTLSRQLMDLEEELGKKLFIRGNRKISLTEEGLLLRKRAEEMLKLAERTQAEISAPSEVLTGDVFIGGGETDAMRLLAKVIKKFQKEYPDVHYHLYSGNADDVTERLDKGLLDFGVLIEPADKRKYDYISLPVTDQWGLLMLKDSELATLKYIKPEHLSNIPLIVSQQSQVSNELSGWFGKDLDTLTIIGTYNLVYNASLMVEEGIGYALCLDKLVNTSGDSPLHFVPLDGNLTARLVLVWKKYQFFSKVTEKFLDQMQKEFHDFHKSNT